MGKEVNRVGKQAGGTGPDGARLEKTGIRPGGGGREGGAGFLTDKSKVESCETFRRGLAVFWAFKKTFGADPERGAEERKRGDPRPAGG